MEKLNNENKDYGYSILVLEKEIATHLAILGNKSEFIYLEEMGTIHKFKVTDKLTTDLANYLTQYFLLTHRLSKIVDNENVCDLMKNEIIKKELEMLEEECNFEK